MKEVSELVFILDESGSMGGKEEDIVGGFNASINEQSKKDYETLVTTVLFSNNHKTIHDRINIRNINKMSNNDYRPGGCTALIDAIGDTIEHIKTVQKYVENKPKKTLFIIMTDGLENASHKYSSDDVKKLIKQQKEKHWEFVFMGANIDAVETAKQYGIEESRAASFDIDNISGYYNACNKVMDICLEPTMCEYDIAEEMRSETWKNDLKGN